MKTYRFILIAFFLVSILNIAANLAEGTILIWLTKPLLMPLLAAWFYLGTDRLSKQVSTLIFSGLLFSWAGDCLLLLVQQNPNYFLFGLGSVLIAHLFYITAFVRYPGFAKGWVRLKLWPLLPVFLYLFFILNYLWPDLPGPFQIPVALYSFVISVMLLASMNMKGRIESRQAFQLMLGALLFVLSDSLIAIHTITS